MSDEIEQETESGNVELQEFAEADAAQSLTTTDEPAASDQPSAEVERKSATDLEAVYDVPVKLSAVLGKTRLEVSSLLGLGKGAVIELDRKVGEAIDIYVNNRLVARGEVVLVEDKLGVTMTEIIQTE